MGEIATDKTTGIKYEKWVCPGPRAVLVLVHGIGAHTGRWNFLARFFRAHGISSYAIMLKGFGKAAATNGHADSLKTYLGDIRKLCALVAKENPGKKVFILGESLGGLISFIAAGLFPDLFDGVICISPAFGNRMKFSLLDYIRIFLSGIFNPKEQFDLPFDSDMCTRDAEYRRAMDHDPDEHRSASSGLLVGIAVAQIRSRRLCGRITKPVLFQIAGSDMLVDPEASVRVFNSLKVADKTLKDYPEMLHALSIDTDREKVFDDALNWLEQKL